MNFNESKLGDLCEIRAGGTPSRSKSEYWDNGDIPWIKIGDINNKYVKNASEYITVDGLNNSSAKLFKKGTILYTIFATVGEVAILDFDATTNQAIVGLNHNEKIDTNYLYYFLKSQKDKISNISRGVAQNNINMSILKDIKVPIPDKTVQLKISEVLDNAQGLIDKRKKQIEELDLLVKSKFIEMFGDPVKNQKKLAKVKLSELGEWKTGGTPLRSKSEYYNGNIPWLSSGELNNKYCFKSNEMITESAIIESAAKIIEVGSLLLGMYDTAALKSTINMIECSCNQAIAYSKLNENLVNTVYVYYCIQIGKEFYKSQQRGVRQKNLNLSMVKGLEILMPPLEFQNQFAEFVKQVDKLKFEMEKSLKELEDNFNSLMQNAFKGELLSK
ncbi:restriction endonuclease subunit S [Clostridium perfringens]|uniref:restriction endonuclease subunit S n=1 Tax=Clostridium perfringens TaxID=1502 RepID=UPI001CC4BACD|nr:restriction endonuclease subunit S [Clostridium perfringens]CAG9359545.1 restriction endonuclease S subunit [Clostridium perfringens]